MQKFSTLSERVVTSWSEPAENFLTRRIRKFSLKNQGLYLQHDSLIFHTKCSVLCRRARDGSSLSRSEENANSLPWSESSTGHGTDQAIGDLPASSPTDEA